ncbi:type 1 glutamine amidotransferase [Candidatus Uhrbacteria bacterium]|nr:type 1 glutamine amidotransferase [Candidatus Uhrbacteria bacterium]
MKLSGKKIAILVEKYYEEIELWYPYYRLREEGAIVVRIGSGTAKTYEGKYGYPVTPDKSIDEVNAKDFDAVIIPGGFSPDFMRRSEHMVQFVKDIYAHRGVAAAICHGPWMLISANLVRGKKATSFFAIKTDMVNAGAEYIDTEVVSDQRIVTSRKPDDLPAFCKAIIDALE